jgi:hypothetical protein
VAQGALREGISFTPFVLLATFLAIFLGCATVCLPAFVPSRFALVVAAYSAADNALIAFSGKYRSPVTDDGLPDLVRQFRLPQSFRLCCDGFIFS